MDYCHNGMWISQATQQHVRFINNLPNTGRLSVVFVYTTIGPEYQRQTNRIGAYADENGVEFIYPAGSLNREIHYYAGRVLFVVPGKDIYFASEGR